MLILLEACHSTHGAAVCSAACAYTVTARLAWAKLEYMSKSAKALLTCAVLLQIWLTAISGVEPQLKNDQMERSSYYIFDTALWEAVRKDNFVLHYDAIERAPGLARPAHGAAGAAGNPGPAAHPQ